MKAESSKVLSAVTPGINGTRPPITVHSDAAKLYRRP